MNRTLLGLAVVMTMLSAASARAQATARVTAATEPPLDEIARGVFLGLDVGPAFLTEAPAPSGGNRPFTSGATVRLELGYDFGRFLSLSLFFAGTTYGANADYIGASGGSASGDFSSIAGGLALRWNAIGFSDSQGVQRTWLYLKAAGGLALLKPNALFSPDPTESYGSILVFGGPGVQYYTRLRHFSVGVEVVGSYLVKPKAFGFAVTPNLRYAF
jgi:hypothetical protein